MYRVFLVMLLMIMAISLPVVATPVQWAIEDGGNGHWYEAVLVQDGISWTDARYAAISQGGYLATVTSKSENDFIFSLVVDNIFWNRNASQTPAWHGAWLGGYSSEGSWAWITGELWTYNNWFNLNYLGDGSYTHFYAFDAPADTWDDENNQHPWLPVVAYVIEVPEPATLSLLVLGGLAAMRKRRA